MGNCLVTKLVGVVNNDNLPVFNTKKFSIINNASGNLYLKMPSEYNGTATFSSGITVTDKNSNPLSNPVAIPDSQNNYLVISAPSGGGTVNFTEFDKFEYFGFRWELNNTDISSFETCLNISFIGGNQANLIGEVRNFVEAQISYGRTSGTILAKGYTSLKVDNVASPDNTITINSATSYTINSDTWNLINGVWVKQ